MNFNSWIFRGWNHRSQNQRAVASGNDNFVANSVQAIAAICTICSGQKHTLLKSILSLLQIQFWRMNHQRVSDVCCNQVANTQTTYTYTLQNSGIALLSQINGSFGFFSVNKIWDLPIVTPQKRQEQLSRTTSRQSTPLEKAWHPEQVKWQKDTGLFVFCLASLHPEHDFGWRSFANQSTPMFF